MPEKNPPSSNVFEVDRVRQLVELMNECDMAEVDLRQGDQRIHLRKKQDLVATAMAAPLAPVASAAAPAPAASPAAQPAAAAEAAPPANAAFITSPMVGTFYSSANPESPPFVKVGDQVGPETVVCIVEAMKVFNEIPADCSGKIVKVLVENGDAVEYGQKLFQVEK
ncbi:MAG: acetyl-CoA carboxylase, biotin carboxyl carrier protein [Planctomycetaceae bacterium]|nr:acetyl-CoA carboxylase, biotin carboxyl carrier protein [Planctomycetaceae bacterium]